MQSDKTIIQSLDAFIRKYYKNKLLKGAIYAFTLLLSLFIIAALLENFGYFSTAVRTVMFWVLVLSIAFILAFYVVSPLLKMYKLGKRISYQQAAIIVGDFFPEIKDKLLNLLQLQEMHSVPSDDLLQASIQQKTSQLKPIPFLNAVNLKDNRKYLKYASIPLAILLACILIKPDSIISPTKRIVNHNTYYQRPAPFTFTITNPSLQAPQQSDFLLQVAVEGASLPAEAFINIEGRVYKFSKVDNSHFTYLFKKVQKSLNFTLEAANVVSPQYTLSIFPNPLIANFQAHLSYPSYIGKPNEVVSNEGNLVVPEGTVVQWSFQTKHVDTLHFLVDSAIVQHLSPTANGRLSLSRRIMASLSYGFFASNAFSPSSDTLRYSVTAVPDAIPMIMALETNDSAYPDRRFFHGRIKDDYGFTKLDFKMVRTNASDTSKKNITSYPIAIKKESAQEFFYSINLAEFQLLPGDRLSYYFEVWDNDGVHGPKSATSQQFSVEIPSEEELENILDRNATQAQDKAETSLSELKKLEQDINDLMRRLVDKKELNWQDKKELQELAKKQQQVKEMLNQMQQQLQENSRLEEKYREQNEQIIEKQKELDRLMNEVMNDEMKEMMKEIDRLMQEVDKKKVQEQLENLKQSNTDLEKQLDQNIELMKRLEMEKKVESAIKKTEQLAEQQRQLSKESENAKGKDKEQLLEKQQQLSQEYQDLKKEIDQIQKDYKNIDQSIDFKVDKDLENKISQEQKSAEDQLRKGNGKNASQPQKQAADDLEQLSEQLAESQMEVEQSDLAEDVEMIRRLLKNLVQLSFNQESLISQVNNTYIQDPKYQNIIVNQNRVKSDFTNVEDSLRAVAKRQVSVAAVINRELSSINSNIKKSLANLLEFNQTFYGNSKNTGAAKPMQYSMTSLNNLSLVLAESLDQMQNQMRQNQQKKNQGNCKRQGMKKQGNCSNPGKGKPSAKSMKQMQDELNKQMEALKKQLEKSGSQSTQGRKKIGEKNSISEEFAKMAAQQEMIRRMMQEYGQQMKQENAGDAKMAREISEMLRQMEQTETDLVNKTITQQTIRRQQQILSRMLEHEKAEMQREKELRRESHEAKDIYQPSQSDLEQFKKLQEKNIELFQTTPPSLSPYYKEKVNDYFYNF